MEAQAVVDQWLAAKDAKYRDEAKALAARLRKRAGGVEVHMDRHGILYFGRGADGFGLIGLTVRKDGLRLYANVTELARHKVELGRKLTGKVCVTLKRCDDIDDALLDAIVAGSLAANSACQAM